MARYPRTQNEIAALAGRTINGYREHPADFPTADPDAIQAALDSFNDFSNQLTQAQAQATLIAKEKQHALDELNKVLKGQIKRSEVDAADEPVKLTEIGWGTTAQRQPLTAPHQPTDLVCTSQGDGTASFEWEKAATGSRPTGYILQRRLASGAGQESGGWKLVDFYYDNMITASNQPTGVKLEYRVIATNPAGQSMPSNIVAVGFVGEVKSQKSEVRSK
jgi:hypothetical protein